MGNTLIFIGLLVCIPSFIIGIPIVLCGIIVKIISKNNPQQSLNSKQTLLQQIVTAVYNSTHKQVELPQKQDGPLPISYMKSSTYNATIAKLEEINRNIIGGLEREITKYDSLLQSKNIKVVSDNEFTRITGKP